MASGISSNTSINTSVLSCEQKKLKSTQQAAEVIELIDVVVDTGTDAVEADTNIDGFDEYDSEGIESVSLKQRNVSSKKTRHNESKCMLNRACLNEHIISNCNQVIKCLAGENISPHLPFENRTGAIRKHAKRSVSIAADKEIISQSQQAPNQQTIKQSVQTELSAISEPAATLEPPIQASLHQGLSTPSIINNTQAINLQTSIPLKNTATTQLLPTKINEQLNHTIVSNPSTLIGKGQNFLEGINTNIKLPLEAFCLQKEYMNIPHETICEKFNYIFVMHFPISATRCINLLKSNNISDYKKMIDTYPQPPYFCKGHYEFIGDQNIKLEDGLTCVNFTHDIDFYPQTQEEYEAYCWNVIYTKRETVRYLYKHILRDSIGKTINFEEALKTLNNIIPETKKNINILALDSILPDAAKVTKPLQLICSPAQNDSSVEFSDCLKQFSSVNVTDELACLKEITQNLGRENISIAGSLLCTNLTSLPNDLKCHDILPNPFMSYSQPEFYQANCYEYFLNNEQQIIHDSSIVSTLPPALASTQYPPLNTATLASDNAIAIAEFPTMQCVSHSFGILMQVNTLVHEANRIEGLSGDERNQSKARITAAISWLVEHGILLTGTIGNYSGSPLAVNAAQLASGLHGFGAAASITATGYRLNQTRHALKIQRWNTSDGCAAEFLNMMDRLRLGRNLAADVSMVLSQLGFLSITLATSFTPLSLATRLLAYSPCALLSLYHMFNKKMTAHLNSESNLLLNVAKLLISKKIELNALLLEYRTSSCIWLNALTGIRSYSPKLEQKFLKKIVTILKSHDNPICEMTIDDIYQNNVGNYFLKSDINETTVLAQFIDLIIKYRNNDNLKSKGFSLLFHLKIHESQISKKIIEPLIENIAICEKLTLFTSKYFEDLFSKTENQRLWNNVPCVFTTANIENDFGDSTYTVSINEMKRHAPINTKRYPHLLNNNNSYICYFDPRLRNTLLQNHFKQLHIYFEGISDNIIVFKIINIHDGTKKYFKASTIPKIGLKVIDFNIDKQGKLTDRHIGHEINNILK